MSEPSASDVAALAAEANRKRQRWQPPKPQQPENRPNWLVFTEHGDTATLSIKLGPPVRGRDVPIALLSPVMIAAVWGAWAKFGMLGAMPAFLICAGVVAWLVITAPPLKLQMTKTGDFILYMSNPRWPRWAGSLRAFRIDLMPHSSGGSVVMLSFSPQRKDNRAETIGVANKSDLAILREAAAWGDFEISPD